MTSQYTLAIGSLERILNLPSFTRDAISIENVLEPMIASESSSNICVS